MDKLENPQAKLLHFVSDLRKQNEINDSQKSKLKQIILFEDARLLELLAQYEKNNDRNAFKEGVINLIQDKDSLPTLGVTVPKTKEEPTEYQEGTSPLDNQLFMRKKNQQSGNGLSGLAQALKPMH